MQKSEELKGLFDQMIEAINSKSPDVGVSIWRFWSATGYNRSVFAGKIGVSTQTVNRWINGKCVPQPGNLLEVRRLMDDFQGESVKLAQALECVRRSGDYVVLPKALPGAFLRAVVKSGDPSVEQLEYLLEAQANLGIELTEQLCVAILSARKSRA